MWLGGFQGSTIMSTLAPLITFSPSFCVLMFILGLKYWWLTIVVQCGTGWYSESVMICSCLYRGISGYVELVGSVYWQLTYRHEIWETAQSDVSSEPAHAHALQQCSIFWVLYLCFLKVGWLLVEPCSSDGNFNCSTNLFVQLIFNVVKTEEIRIRSCGIGLKVHVAHHACTWCVTHWRVVHDAWRVAPDAWHPTRDSWVCDASESDKAASFSRIIVQIPRNYYSMIYCVCYPIKK